MDKYLCIVGKYFLNLTHADPMIQTSPWVCPLCPTKVETYRTGSPNSGTSMYGAL